MYKKQNGINGSFDFLTLKNTNIKSSIFGKISNKKVVVLKHSKGYEIISR